MTTDFPDPFRQSLKHNIEQSRQAFDTFMAAWLTAQATLPSTAALQPLGNKIIQSFRDNAAAHFAFALRLIASKDASDALKIYAQHVEERMHTLSQQFQEIGSLAIQTGAANKSEQFGDISSAKRAANKTELPDIPTMPVGLRTNQATPQFSPHGGNGLLSPEVASAQSSTKPRITKRGGKSKKKRNLQKAAAKPAAGKAMKNPRK